MIVAFKGPSRQWDIAISQSDTMLQFQQTQRLEVVGIVVDIPKASVEGIRKNLEQELQQPIKVITALPGQTF